MTAFKVEIWINDGSEPDGGMPVTTEVIEAETKIGAEAKGREIGAEMLREAEGHEGRIIEATVVAEAFEL